MRDNMKKKFIQEEILKNENDDKIYLNILDKKSLDVIIIVHGFDSNKSGSNFLFLSEHLDCSIVSFDLPSHGESCEKLLLKNCLNDLLIVDEYTRKRFAGKNICLFGSSLGSYIILNHVKNNPDLPYKFIFLKSTAVKSAEIFKRCIIPDMDSFKENGYFIRNRNKEMIIPYEFYDEMVKNRIEKVDDSKNIFYFFHGICDDLALFSDLESILSSSVHLIKIPGANHSFNDDEFSVVVNEINSALSKAK